MIRTVLNLTPLVSVIDKQFGGFDVNADAFKSLLMDAMADDALDIDHVPMRAAVAGDLVTLAPYGLTTNDVFGSFEMNMSSPTVKRPISGGNALAYRLLGVSLDMSFQDNAAALPLTVEVVMAEGGAQATAPLITPLSRSFSIALPGGINKQSSQLFLLGKSGTALNYTASTFTASVGNNKTIAIPTAPAIASVGTEVNPFVVGRLGVIIRNAAALNMVATMKPIIPHLGNAGLVFSLPGVLSI